MRLENKLLSNSKITFNKKFNLIDTELLIFQNPNICNNSTQNFKTLKINQKI